MVIGLCGFIGSGKNTVAEYLIQSHQFQQESFASTLKDVVASAFSWDRQKLEGITEEDRIWRETVDPWWAEKLNMPTLTPRWILQYWGTDVIRNNFHNDMWIYSLQKKIQDNRSNFIITDCRFKNEINSVKALNGKIIWVRRDLPSWYKDAQLALAGDTASLNKLDNMSIHPSEYQWLDTSFDYVIENDCNLEALHVKIRSMLEVCF